MKTKSHFHEPLYRTILREAWATTKRRRDLWLLGFFATFLQLGGITGVLTQFFAQIPTSSSTGIETVRSAYPGAGLIAAFNQTDLPNGFWTVRSIGLFLVIGLVALAFVWILAVAEAGLIASVRVTKIKKPPTINAVLNRGRTVAWRVVALHLIARLALGVGFILASLPLLLAINVITITHTILTLVTFVIALLLVLTISFMTIYAVAAVVIDNESFSHALMNAWRLVYQHWLISIETALILAAIGTIATFGLALVVLLLSIPATLLLMAGVVAGSGPFVTLVISLFLIATVALILFLGSVFTTFSLTAWTLLYERLRRHGATAKLVRIIHDLPHLLGAK